MELQKRLSPLALAAIAAIVGSSIVVSAVCAHELLYRAQLMPVAGCAAYPDATGDLTMQADEDTQVFDVLDLTIAGIFPDDLDNSHGPNGTSMHIYLADDAASPDVGPVVIDLGWYIDAGFGMITETAEGFQVTISGILTGVQGAYDMTAATGLTPEEVIGEMEEGHAAIIVYATGCAEGAIAAPIYTEVEEEEVTVDISPGMCPTVIAMRDGHDNHWNDEDERYDEDDDGDEAHNHGLFRRAQLRVAILGSEDFDVNEIDLTSLELAGVPATAAWVRDRYSPECPGFRGKCRFRGEDFSESCTVSCCRRDGNPDVIALFDKADVIDAIDDTSVESGEPVEVSLHGELDDGDAITGSDCIIFVGHSHRHRDGHHDGRGPSGPALGKAWPNPFNPVTRITYYLPDEAHVELAVYDVSGRLVEHLVSESRGPGEHTVQWDASGMASGIYFYRLSVGNEVQTRKMILLK